MIVVCERCSTRFQLDEARLPARGAQVRCSRCKHAFFVAPPGSTDDTVVQEVLAETTGPGGSSAPTVTTDLDHTAVDGASGRGPEADDDEWEFNEDPPAAPGSRKAPPKARTSSPELEIARPEAASEPDPAAVPDSLIDELGDPKDWDFGAESSADAAVPQAAEPEPAPQKVPAPEEEEETPPPARKASRRKRGRKAAPKASRTRRRTPGGVSSLLLEGVGYLAVALLFGTGFGRVVGRGIHPASPAPAISAAAVPVVGGGAEGVRVDFLENAPAGTIVVVSGRRDPAAAGTALRVEWTAHGRPIPGTATLAGPAIPTAWLREADPRELRRLLAEAATRPAAPSGASSPGHAANGFVAVYEGVPEGATGLRITPVSSPGTPVPSPAQGAGAAGGAAAPEGSAPAGAGASPSSPPSPPPSSG